MNGERKACAAQCRRGAGAMRRALECVDPVTEADLLARLHLKYTHTSTYTHTHARAHAHAHTHKHSCNTHTHRCVCVGDICAAKCWRVATLLAWVALHRDTPPHLLADRAWTPFASLVIATLHLERVAILILWSTSASSVHCVCDRDCAWMPSPVACCRLHVLSRSAMGEPHGAGDDRAEPFSHGKGDAPLP